jgi:hypothetical protein
MAPGQQHPRAVGDRAQPHHPHVAGDPAARPSAAAPASLPASSSPPNHASPRRSPPLNPNAAAFSQSGQEGTPDWLRFSPSPSRVGGSPTPFLRPPTPTRCGRAKRRWKPRMVLASAGRPFLKRKPRPPPSWRTLEERLLAGSLHPQVSRGGSRKAGNWSPVASPGVAALWSLPVRHRRPHAVRCQRIRLVTVLTA